MKLLLIAAFLIRGFAGTSFAAEAVLNTAKPVGPWNLEALQVDKALQVD